MRGSIAAHPRFPAGPLAPVPIDIQQYWRHMFARSPSAAVRTRTLWSGADGGGSASSHFPGSLCWQSIKKSNKRAHTGLWLGTNSSLFMDDLSLFFPMCFPNLTTWAWVPFIFLCASLEAQVESCCGRKGQRKSNVFNVPDHVLLWFSRVRHIAARGFSAQWCAK